jgi:hypothetical protein
MLFSHLPAFLSRVFANFTTWLDCRTGDRLPLLLTGMLFASERRTVTSWFRPVGITTEFRRAYHVVYAVGRNTEQLALATLSAVRPCLANPQRLLFAIDDTPTPRYGPCVEGAGIHHNPTPGPAGEKYVYGHIWVMLAAVAKHPDWGTIALPVQAELYVRHKDVPALPMEYHFQFRTKLELAVAQLRWLKPWVCHLSEQLWVAVDGGYAKRAFLRPARQEGFTVVSRLRKDAALRSLPLPKAPSQRGPQATYGKERLSLAKRAGQPRGWQQVECTQYGEQVTKTYKTFLATYVPAGGVIRVVVVKEEHGWIPFFSTKAEASVVDILEAAADRGSIEQTNHDVKEIWGAGQQQVRNLYCSIGCFNLNCWMYSLVEAWAWEKSAEDLVDRSQSPWDEEPRRPSHADKRKALQREVLRAEIEAALAGPPNKQRFRELAERLLDLAA